MPLLDIKYPTESAVNLLVKLQSLMAYPEDESKRTEYRDVILAYADSRAIKSCFGSTSFRVSGKFIHYNSHEQVLKDRDCAIERGSLVGNMLCDLYFMSVQNKLPSLEKAKTLTGKRARFDLPGVINVGSSRKPLQDYWNEYKTVSHLWAATLIWSTLGFNLESEKSWTCHVGVGEVLAISERFRVFAESTKIGINDNEKYIFDKDTAWRVPASCVIPDCDLSAVTSLTTLAAAFPGEYSKEFEKESG